MFAAMLRGGEFVAFVDRCGELPRQLWVGRQEVFHRHAAGDLTAGAASEPVRDHRKERQGPLRGDAEAVLVVVPPPDVSSTALSGSTLLDRRMLLLWPAGRSILDGANAILTIPRHSLAPGRHEVALNLPATQRSRGDDR